MVATKPVDFRKGAEGVGRHLGVRIWNIGHIRWLSSRLELQAAPVGVSDRKPTAARRTDEKAGASTSQIKWICPSIMAPIKSLIFLKTNSHAKMAPDIQIIYRSRIRTGCHLATSG
jgi:hypothetical protein